MHSRHLHPFHSGGLAPVCTLSQVGYHGDTSPFSLRTVSGRTPWEGTKGWGHGRTSAVHLTGLRKYLRGDLSGTRGAPTCSEPRAGVLCSAVLGSWRLPHPGREPAFPSLSTADSEDAESQCVLWTRTRRRYRQHSAAPTRAHRPHASPLCLGIGCRLLRCQGSSPAASAPPFRTSSNGFDLSKLTDGQQSPPLPGCGRRGG